MFDVTPVTITNWMSNGLPHKKINKRDLEIDSAEAIEWYIRYKYSDIDKKVSTKEDAEHYDAEYRKYKAELMKHKALKERGELITVGEAEELMTDRLIKIREQLMNIPLSWAPYMIGMESNQDSQEKLQDLLNELLAILAGLPDPQYDPEEDDDDIEDEDIEDVKNITENS